MDCCPAAGGCIYRRVVFIGPAAGGQPLHGADPGGAFALYARPEYTAPGKWFGLLRWESVAFPKKISILSYSFAMPLKTSTLYGAGNDDSTSNLALRTVNHLLIEFALYEYC